MLTPINAKAVAHGLIGPFWTATSLFFLGNNIDNEPVSDVIS